jgi:hypothetical protein
MEQVKWALLISAICLSLAVAILKGVHSSQATVGSWALTAVLVVVAAGALWKLRGSFSVASTATFTMKRFFYRRLRNQTPLGGHAAVSRLAAAIINQHFTSIRFKRRDQNSVADRVVNAIRSGTKIIFVEGVSGAGKTATSLIAIDKLLTDGEAVISDYARRILYFDLSVDPSSIETFIRNCASGLLHDAFVIIDNFHRIPPESIASFSELITGVQPQCRALIVLTQPRQFVTLSPSANIDAFDFAEKNGAWFKLTPPRSAEIPGIFPRSTHCDAISQGLDRLGVARDDAVRWVAHASLERVFQMARDEKDHSLLDLMGCGASTEELPPARLLRLVAAISALSIYRGAFSAEDLRVAIAALSPGRFFNTGRHALHLEFRCLKRNGFVLEAVGRSRVFVFHQTLAEYLKERFSTVPAFADAFLAAGSALRKRDWVRSDPLMDWLYAVELRDYDAARRTFSSALCSGAYAMMRRALLRNDRSGSSDSMDYECGVLAEKVGAWTDARVMLRNFVSSRVGDRDTRAKATISLIEAEHGPESRSQLLAISQDDLSSDFVRASARYWLLHLDAHEGNFDTAQMDDVLSALEENRTRFVIDHRYDFLHLARRAFFDRVRFHYLAGSCDGSILKSIYDRPIAGYLAAHHVAFSAYLEKFVFGHCIHYDYVFQLGVLGIRPTVDEFILPSTASNDLDGMIDAAIGYYQSAMNRFAVFGDKTKDYIKPRLYEMQMIRRGADLDRILPDLNAYRTAVDESGLLDLAPYPHVYHFKYYVKKTFDDYLRMPTHEETGLEAKAYDVGLGRASSSLGVAELAFAKSHNTYGRSMCRLFRLLITALERRDFAGMHSELDALLQDATRLGYQRIATVAAYLQGNNPSAYDLVRTIMYFPLVHQ